MKVYLDTTVVIAFLYGELVEPERFTQARKLFHEVETGSLWGVVSLYVLPELYGYVVDHFSEDQVSEIFRLGLVELFTIPVVVMPYLDRVELELWKRRFSMRDATDVAHVAMALSGGCDYIATYDEHFQDVADLIPARTPEELLEILTEEKRQ